MVRDISGLGGPPDTSTRTARNGPTAVSDTSTAKSVASPTDERNDVELSNQAKNLQTQVDSIRATPGVNETRVAGIKAALASGEFRIDNLQLADKLLANDSLF